MAQLPLTVLIGVSMILIGLILGVYVAVKAIARNRQGKDPLD